MIFSDLIERVILIPIINRGTENTVYFLYEQFC